MNELTSASLQQQIIDVGLHSVEQQILALAKQAVGLTLEPANDNDIAVGATKFGGRPDLPLNAKWPTFEGESLRFLLQLNLRDLASFDNVSPLPQDGLLALFGYEEDGDGPGVFGDDDIAIIYCTSNQKLERRVEPEDLDDSSANGPTSIVKEMTLSWDFPDWYGGESELPAPFFETIEQLRQLYTQSFPNKCVELKRIYAKLINRLSALRRACNRSKHHLFGYSIHNRTTEPCPGADWTHLLTVNSDEHLEWNWCDGEHLSVFVHNEALANRKFDRIFGYAS